MPFFRPPWAGTAPAIPGIVATARLKARPRPCTRTLAPGAQRSQRRDADPRRSVLMGYYKPHLRLPPRSASWMTRLPPASNGPDHRRCATGGRRRTLPCRPIRPRGLNFIRLATPEPPTMPALPAVPRETHRGSSTYVSITGINRLCGRPMSTSVHAQVCAPSSGRRSFPVAVGFGRDDLRLRPRAIARRRPTGWWSVSALV